MRVPVFIVVLLSLTVIGGVWWQGTRKYDFLAEPSEAKLAEIRQRSVAPAPQTPAEPVRGPALPVVVRGREAAPSSQVVIDPEVDPGDLSTPPHLDLYQERAPQGAAHFLALASLLETRGELQRALLAWERVLDRAQPDPEQTRAAVAAIRRLRSSLPDWNTDANARKVLVLKIGTVKSKSAVLKPVADDLVKDLEQASSGMVRFKVIMEAGKDPKAGTPLPPAALWISGDGDKAPSGDPVAFASDKQELLARDMRKAFYQALRAECGKSPNLTPPPATNEAMGSVDAIRWAITRAEWAALAKRLSTPAVAPVAPATPENTPRRPAREGAPTGTKERTNRKPTPQRPASQPSRPANPPARPVRQPR